jgi:hypothetical protein
MTGVAIFVTLHYLPGSTGLSLTRISRNNAGTGSGFGSGGIAYSANPLFYPMDVFVVLFDPLPFNAHGAREWLEALENTLMLGVVLTSLRALRILSRASFSRPYILMCVIFTGAFRYAFAPWATRRLITWEAAVSLVFS